MWPKHMVLNLYSCEYKDRISVISFLYKNAFPPHYAFDMIKFYARPSRNGTSWTIREMKLRSVWKKCEEVDLNGNAVDREKYFYYSMNDKAVFNYAGQRKLYGKIVMPAIKNYAPRRLPTENTTDDLTKHFADDEDHEILAHEIASKFEKGNNLHKLLYENEELENLAMKVVSDAEKKYEQDVLNDLLAEIRNST